jgi:hypothetical protein
MAFGSKEAGCGLIILLAIILLPPGASGGEVRLDVVHDHMHKGRRGVMTLGEKGISFEEAPKEEKPSSHRWEWPYHEIRQLELAPDRLRILTYRDRWWKLGADKEYEFRLPAAKNFEDAYRVLEERLDQRFVAATGAVPEEVLWELPVKHLERFGGSHGVLVVGRDTIAYRTSVKRESRTWRYSDLVNISTSDPFQLTITTHERARLHYGSRKDFNFQLKQPLNEARYNDLWRRLNRARGLSILTSYQEKQQ